MALAQKEETARTDYLEAYFRQYPDVPREIILKVDLLSLGHWFTDAALEATKGSTVKSYRLFSYDLMPMADMKRQEGRKVPEYFSIFGGPYDLRPLSIQTTLSAASPYVVDLVEGRPMLLVDGRPICEVRFPRAPKYYAKSFPDGTTYHEVIAFGYFCTVFRTCQYWGPKEECKFCDINENARQMKQSQSFTLTAPVKRVDYVAEVANEVQREISAREGFPAPIGFIFTGGTILNKLHGKTEEEFYGEYVERVKWGGPRRQITLQTNAKPKETLKWYRSIGLDSHHANIEVWGKHLFEWINPGKARRIGWEEWVRMVVESVDVFGEGYVRPNLVCGVEMAQPHGYKTVKEAVASTTEGIEFLMSHGVVPRCNQWRREPGAYLVKNHEQPPIPMDFYVQLMRNRYEIWKKYALPLPPDYAHLNREQRYMGAAHGTYDDYILLMENTYPPNLIDLVEEGSTTPYPVKGG